MTLTLSGEPKSTQTIYRATCRGRFPTTYMTAEGKALKEQYYYEVKSQWRGPVLQGDITVTVRFFFANKRRRDLDNMNKLVLDSLTGIVYEDDSQIAELHLHRGYDAQRPRTEITVQ
ncbi:MAG: RusA family crossover junction endodeoxyribonuclease [Pseudolabrys sp.]